MAATSKNQSSKNQSERVKGALIGVVESDKRPQSRRVTVTYLTRHEKYGKYMKKRQVVQCHDEGNVSKLGDRVEIAPCRPVSKTKSWAVVRVVESAPGS